MLHKHAAVLNSGMQTPSYGIKRPPRAKRLACIASVRARWCLDVRYGRKGEAITLLQEWIREVGATAGLQKGNTRVSTGSIGVPESRLEMEVVFASISEWEKFLSSIPAKQHKAWSQRIQALIVDGSPKWELYRSCDSGLEGESESASNFEEKETAGNVASKAKLHLDYSDSSSQAGKIEIADDDTSQYVVDWKGDPMKLNPGDKLPFKFL